ncbi:hypothetical protein SAM23877_1328 [Streptomyces ambofaciens ATCC 23877]|uniref:Uncharacterized protein n=1 Tax=Streptomyces ambofaciens (strain ATCC 23877 / 3486 / DSM 40053 / JCM 4204 / NBRC 12836 / NRRL B-2516) TaxID=278992 RepID=A0A0K2ANE6_STRA7|nr:hypothetical protein SAM23877_1328 [Streptomyces ambofaciens ATCC 23877]
MVSNNTKATFHWDFRAGRDKIRD